MYVSDRRLVKSVQMLQVAAFCNGRAEVRCKGLAHAWQMRRVRAACHACVHGACAAR